MYEGLRDCSGFCYQILGRISKGARDYLLNKPTSASRRYRRSIIRQREKARRDKLKYGEEREYEL